MKKKRIAAFATGWGEATIEKFFTGVLESLKGINADLYLFVAYAMAYDEPNEKIGEVNIFNLPNLKEFDGAVIMGNVLDFDSLFEQITERCQEANIPYVCTGRKAENAYFVGADNYAGTKTLCEHLLDDHHISDVFFIAGANDNPDSRTRLKALEDALAERNKSLAPDHILITDWSPDRAGDFIVNRHELGAPMPEAFICANDILAMSVSSKLIECGYRVPEDIKVTGFDHEYYAQVYDPSISSVEQNFDIIGERCGEVLCNVLSGKEAPREQYVPCEFVASESCGCTSSQDFDKLRRVVGRQFFVNHMEDSIFENLLSGVDRNVMGSSAYDDIREKLTASYHNNHAYEGESFHILLDPLFEKTITDSARKLRTVGYPKVMDAIFSVEKGHICTNKTFPTSKLVPQISDTEENRLFMFLPLKEGKYSFGYLIFCDDIHKLSNYNRLFKYESRMNVILSKFRQNLSFNYLNKKLHEMNETDSLTQVKNRAAFERREAELNERMNSAHKPVYAIAMFDINNLKLVNDDYGHDYGDDYIIKCCRLVCETFKRSPVFRLGGDEFLALLTDFDYEERDLLMENMKLKMLSYKDSNLPPYETLSLASGLAAYNPETDKELHDVFKRADAAMYENKAFMKGGAKSIR